MTDCTYSVPNGFHRGEGIIRNFNTIEEYRSVDKPAHLERAGRMVSERMQNTGPENRTLVSD